MTPAPLLKSMANASREQPADNPPSAADAQFFGLWLDRSMSHSAAMFQDGDGLYAAQTRKVDYLLAAARCHNARRVLDIGCGWGAALERMVTHFNVQRPVGLTPSSVQAQWASSHRPARIQLRTENWQQHETLGSYDAIVSTAALEHLCRASWPREKRNAVFRQFFEKCRHWLKPGGRMALQTIVQGNRRSDQPMLVDTPPTLAPDPADHGPAHVGEIIDATHGLFDIVRLRNDPEHHARTCNEWGLALARCRSTAVALVGVEIVGHYERHLHALQRQFEAGRAGLARLVLQAI